MGDILVIDSDGHSGQFQMTKEKKLNIKGMTTIPQLTRANRKTRTSRISASMIPDTVKSRCYYRYLSSFITLIF